MKHTRKPSPQHAAARQPSRRAAAWHVAMTRSGELLRAREAEAALRMLERAHILGQPDFIPHLTTHLWMLRAAWASRDIREMGGQVLRLLLTPIGHLTGRLPLGNTGRANVSAFQPMKIPPDMAHFFDTPND